MRSVLSLALVALLVAGCDSSTTEPVPADQSDGSVGIVPLAIGNAWEFSGTRTIRTQPDQPTVALPGTGTLRVVETMTRDGETWYRLSALPDTPGSTPEVVGILHAAYSGWVTNRADGLYRLRYSASDTLGTPYRTVAYPVGTGDVYSVVPPFAVSDTTGWHFEQLVTVKRTDHPVAAAGVPDTEGPMLTSVLERFRQNGQDYPFPVDTPVLRSVYGLGVGFAYLEAGYVSLRTGGATLDGVYRFTLVSASIQPTAVP